MSRSARFTVLVAWTTLSFAASLVGGLILSPLVVRGLGIEAYGVWALVFSLLDYLAIADLGIRSATIKYVAHYSALDDQPKLFGTLNASLLYFSVIAFAVAAIIFFGAARSLAFFHVPAALAHDYVLLLRLTGITMAFQLLFNVPKAALEGVQDFPAISRINISVSVIRTTLCLGTLHYKLGLGGLGWATVAATWLGFAMIAWTFHRRFPAFLPSWRGFDRAMFYKLLHYGMPTLVGSLAGQFLQNGPVMLLGILKDASNVGYYSLVIRLLAGLYEIVSQAGNITGSSVARLAAENDQAAVERTVLYLNRYTLAIFSFVTASLLVFGRPLFTLWVGPAVAAHCLPLIPWLAGAYALGCAAHQHSIATLFGLAAHRSYNFGLVIEGLVLLGGWLLFVPGRPLWFAAAWWAISLVLNRGLRTSWLVSRKLNISWTHLLAGIYFRPLLVAALTIACEVMLLWLFPPASWTSLAGLGAIAGMVHLGFSIALVMSPEHRSLLFRFRHTAAPVVAGN
jgi:O-antigen/teichoic acid export membrane protein